MSSATLQDDPSVESFFNLVATETLALFEHLSFEFLDEYEVFVPSEAGRTRDHEPSELMRGFLHCYYKDIYGIRPVTRELQNTFVWLGCGFDQPPSRDTVDRFLTDLEHVVDFLSRLLLLTRCSANLHKSEASSKTTEQLSSSQVEIKPWP